MEQRLTKRHPSMRRHSNEIPNRFTVDVKERQGRLPTMFWSPKLHKIPYKARFIANSCTTTELSKLLTSWLTVIKAKVIKYCETAYERSGKSMFWSIKYSGEVLSKLKDRGFQTTSLSTYDFSTLYTTLPHNLIWSCQNVCDALSFLLDNIYIRFGTKLY